MARASFRPEQRVARSGDSGKLGHLMVKLHAYIIVALAVVVAGPGCGGAPPEARSAQRLIQRGEFRDAELRADEGLKRHPDHPALWRAKIQAIMGQLEVERAVATYRTWHGRRQGHDGQVLRRMALTTLWQGLRVPSGLVQARAIQAIERLEIEALAADVAKRLEDDDDVVAAAASVALLRSRPGAAQIATELLGSEDPHARAIAVEGIGRKIKARARADLLPALGDRDALVRRAAVSAIAAMMDAADTARLLDMARSDPDGSVRAAVLEALATHRREGATRVAAQALGDGYLPARLAAVDVLAAHGDKAGLGRALGAADAAVSLRAAAALDQAATAGKIDQALGDASWEVRAAAVEALPRLVPGPGATELLLARLADTSGLVRVRAALILASMRHARGTEALARLCRDDDEAAREAAIRAHGSQTLLTMGLVEALADTSAPIRVIAAETLLKVLD